MSSIKNLTKGFFKENPVLALAIGLCPTLAVSTSIQNAIGMGAAATLVLVGSSAIISAFKNYIPSNLRMPVYIIIIATFVTMIDLAMQAFSPALSKSLGIFIPLIVVNCIILGRAEAYANKNSVWDSIVDAVGMGIGFMIALVILALFRELLGSGTFYGIPVFTLMGFENFKGSLMMILPPGGFLTMGLTIAFLQWKKLRKTNKTGVAK